MRVAILAPSPVPYAPGGAERLWTGLQRAIDDLTPHDVELIKVPILERTLVEVVRAYELFSSLDLDYFDVVITTKYPAWMIRHPGKVVYLQHTLRGLYDEYPSHLPTVADVDRPEVARLIRLVRSIPTPRLLPELFAAFDEALAALGPDHPVLALPGPLAWEIVHHLDAAALRRDQVRRFLAISRTVAARSYPLPIETRAVPHPSDLEGLHSRSWDYLFTASRLHPAKRIDLLVRAMRYVPDPIELRIAGAGSEFDTLRRLAHGDDRIRFLGRVSSAELVELYAGALAVPFVPMDEDLGLIALEAMHSGKPVVTCSDAGGVVELVRWSGGGLVVDRSPAALGTAMHRLVADPELAMQLGERGRRAAAGVTWRSVVDALFDDLPLPGGRPASLAESPPPLPAQRRRERPAVAMLLPGPLHGDDAVALRRRQLCEALAEGFEVRIVVPSPDGLAAERHVTPFLVETTVPSGDGHTLDPALRGRLAPSALITAELTGITTALVEATRRAAADASAVILGHASLAPLLELADVRVPVIYDAASALDTADPAGTPFAEGAAGIARVAEADVVTSCAALLTTPAAAHGGGDTVAGDGDPEVCPAACAVDTGALPYVGPEARRDRRDELLARVAAGAPRREGVVLAAGPHSSDCASAARAAVEVAAALPELLVVAVGPLCDSLFGAPLPHNVVLIGGLTPWTLAFLLRSADAALLGGDIAAPQRLLECMSSGLPVVCSVEAAAGLDVRDGIHLSIAGAGRLAAAVAETLGRPGVAAARALAARRLVEENHDLRRNGSRLRDLVGRVIARDGGLAAMIESAAVEGEAATAG